MKSNNPNGVLLQFPMSVKEFAAWPVLVIAVIFAFRSIDDAVSSGCLTMGCETERDIRSRLPKGLGGTKTGLSALESDYELRTGIQVIFGNGFIDQLRQRLGCE